MEADVVPMECEEKSDAPSPPAPPAADLLLLLAAPPAGKRREEEDVQVCAGSNHAHSVLLCVAHRCVQVVRSTSEHQPEGRRILANLLASFAVVNWAK